MPHKEGHLLVDGTKLEKKQTLNIPLRKPLRDFTMRSMVTLKQLKSLMAVTGEN